MKTTADIVEFESLEEMRVIITAIDDMKEQARRLVEPIAEKLESLEDNPHIQKRMGNCFIVSSKSISEDPFLRMSPFFHDFKAQYKLIADAIRAVSSDADKIEKILREVISCNRCKDQPINPAAVKNICVAFQKES